MNGTTGSIPDYTLIPLSSSKVILLKGERRNGETQYISAGRYVVLTAEGIPYPILIHEGDVSLREALSILADTEDITPLAEYISLYREHPAITKGFLLLPSVIEGQVAIYTKTIGGWRVKTRRGYQPYAFAYFVGGTVKEPAYEGFIIRHGNVIDKRIVPYGQADNPKTISSALRLLGIASKVGLTEDVVRKKIEAWRNDLLQKKMEAQRTLHYILQSPAPYITERDDPEFYSWLKKSVKPPLPAKPQPEIVRFDDPLPTAEGYHIIGAGISRFTPSYPFVLYAVRYREGGRNITPSKGLLLTCETGGKVFLFVSKNIPDDVAFTTLRHLHPHMPVQDVRREVKAAFSEGDVEEKDDANRHKGRR